MLKVTTKEGAEYFGAEPEAFEGVRLRPDVVSQKGWQVEEVEMTPEEYQAIPATQNTAAIFGSIKGLA